MQTVAKRFYYPSGALETELSLLPDGRPHGVRRTWHSNGVLAAEVPCAYGLQHGTSRFWDEKGKLLGEFEMVKGTGVSKAWFGNGQLKIEGHLRLGNPHGRLRVWDENGKKIGESFWINGRRVSRKKYNEARRTDESLPSYDDTRHADNSR